MSEILTRNDAAEAAQKALAMYEMQVEALYKKQEELQSGKEEIYSKLVTHFEQLVNWLLPADLAQEKNFESAWSKMEEIWKKLDIFLLLKSIREAHEQELADMKAELEEIEELEEFQNAEALADMGTGSLVLELNALKETRDDLKNQITALENVKSFTKVYNYFDDTRSLPFFFWLRFGISKTSFCEALKRLGYKSPKDAFDKYQSLMKQGYNVIHDEIPGKSAEIKNVWDTVNAQKKLAEKIAYHPADLYDHMRHSVTDMLIDIESKTLEDFVRKLPDEFRLVGAVCLTLCEKVTYLKTMIAALQEEIDERNSWFRQISLAEAKWRQNPQALLTANYNNILRQLPVYRANQANERIAAMDAMFFNLYYFENYSLALLMLDSLEDVLFFDLFCQVGTAPLAPLTDYMESIFPEVMIFREEYGTMELTQELQDSNDPEVAFPEYNLDDVEQDLVPLEDRSALDEISPGDEPSEFMAEIEDLTPEDAFDFESNEDFMTPEDLFSEEPSTKFDEFGNEAFAPGSSEADTVGNSPLDIDSDDTRRSSSYGFGSEDSSDTGSYDSGSSDCGGSDD